MPRTDFELKAGDTSPAFEVQLLENDEPLDDTTMESGTFRFHMEHIEDETIDVVGLVAVTDVTESMIAYNWSDGDTDEPGTYEGVFEMDLNDPASLSEFTKDASFPTDGFLRVDINETKSE